MCFGNAASYGTVASDGLIRDHNGAFILVFQRQIGSCSVLAAELWDLRNGLKLAKNCNYSNVVVCTDALEVIKSYPGPNSSKCSSVGVLSFIASFHVNIYRLPDSPTPGKGLTFVVAPDLNVPLNSYGEYLGLPNATTDGNASNRILPVELDTFKEDFDPDANHVGPNINSVRSNNTMLLTPLGFELVGPNGTANFFNFWVQYDGVKKVIEVYIAQQANQTDPTPPRPANPILNSTLELRGLVNQVSYFGFSASTSNFTELNCVLRWNLTVEHYPDEKQLITKITLAAGILAVVLLAAVAGYFLQKRWLARSNPHILGALKSLPGTPREFQYKDLFKATNKFDEKRKLGQGGFGVVYKGYSANENLDVAVKVFTRESLKGKHDFLAELTIINWLRHKHLVRLLGHLRSSPAKDLGRKLCFAAVVPLELHCRCPGNTPPLPFCRRRSPLPPPL
ncbi:hypothetical protein RHMOL_Rhmol13G0054100 [Rhododendron molle]|uniref:Uncharacterized protein n=1 Tax=Rhododendron molle TaxID=49168 RepID=A0ACC0L442_RHOML|nr:hypothetical protein RHMOL_Rhmol13G0054100 [Rhododendron molle]